MHIRTFRAANLNAALAMIREQMGPDASVLHTRQLPAARLNLFGRTRIEVTAGLKPPRAPSAANSAPASPAPASPAPASSAAASPARASSAACERAGERTREPAPERMAAERFEPPRERFLLKPGRRRNRVLDELVDELISAGLPQRIARAWAHRWTVPQASADPRSSAWADARRDASRELLAGPAAEGEYEDSEAEDIEAARGETAQWLEGSLRIGNPILPGRGGRRIVALVGPTGVGKTTTIAKLAAGFQLQQQARVGLLTFDTFRAAAIEQLDAFARTLGAPLAVVRSAAEVPAALSQLGEVDLVLIDTAGQSPCGGEKIAAMGRLLAAARPDETHLVVDANGSFASAVDVCAAFKPLQPTAAIISKLDEVRRPAPVIAGLLEGALQISYMTHGQRVPEDIAAADRRALAMAASGLAAARCGA